MTDSTIKRARGLWRIPMWGGIAVLLAAPAIAMRYTTEVNWTAFDFAFAGAILIGSALLIELVVWRARSVAYRAGVGLALLAAVLMVWAAGAVGIIGSENDPANRLFLGVIAVALVGATISGFRAKGMSRAMFAAGAVQALIAVAALGAGWGATDPSWPLDIVASTGVLVGLWLAAGSLFGKAAREA